MNRVVSNSYLFLGVLLGPGNQVLPGSVLQAEEKGPGERSEPETAGPCQHPVLGTDQISVALAASEHWHLWLQELEGNSHMNILLAMNKPSSFEREPPTSVIAAAFCCFVFLVHPGNGTQQNNPRHQHKICIPKCSFLTEGA